MCCIYKWAMSHRSVNWAIKNTEGKNLRVQFFNCSPTHALTASAWHILQWLCKYCATIDNFCLASLQWLNESKKTRNKKMTRPNSLPLLPPLGFAILFLLVLCLFCFFLFLVFCFFGFLFSGSVLVFWRAGKKNTKWRTCWPRPNPLPVLPL